MYRTALTINVYDTRTKTTLQNEVIKIKCRNHFTITVLEIKNDKVRRVRTQPVSYDVCARRCRYVQLSQRSQRPRALFQQHYIQYTVLYSPFKY